MFTSPPFRHIKQQRGVTDPVRTYYHLKWVAIRMEWENAGAAMVRIIVAWRQSMQPTIDVLNAIARKYMDKSAGG